MTATILRFQLRKSSTNRMKARLILLQTKDWSVHLRIWGPASRRRMAGQVLSHTQPGVAGLAHLILRGDRVETAEISSNGAFSFANIRKGPLGLQLDLNEVTVTGEFADA